MKNHVFSSIAVAVLAATLSGCKDSADPGTNLLPDATIEADVVASAGDAIALAMTTMAGNESAPGAPGADGSDNAGVANVTVSRTTKCFDANGDELADCSPFALVRKIAVHATVEGSRTGGNDAGTKTWSGVVHRVFDDTVTRVFNGSAEASRVHAGVNTGSDTTTFTESTFERIAAETAIDSVKQITWNLPRNSNPWPVSGSFVRRVNVKVTATRDGVSMTREMNLRVQVTFPADNQGNVDLVINNKTCNLNLVTGAVTACV